MICRSARLLSCLASLAMIMFAAGCTHDSKAVVARRTAPRHVQLAAGPECKSGATPLSISLSRGPASEVMALFSAVSGLSVTTQEDMSDVIVSADITEAPWDCLLESMATQLGMDLVSERDSLRLVPGRRK